MNWQEYREQPDCLADFVKWAALVAKGIILNKNGSFQSTFRFRGPDMESSTKSELVTTAARLNNLLARLKGGWAFYCEAVCLPSENYPDTQWTVPVAQIIDDEREAYFRSGHFYESEFYITFLWLPPKDMTARIEKLFFNNKKSSKKEDLNNARDHLGYFTNRLDEIYRSLKHILQEVHRLSDEETLTYLHRTVSSKSHKIRVPEVPIELDYLLTDTPITGGAEPMLGKDYIGVVSIKNFPDTVTPSMLDRLNHVGFPYRWITRFIAFDKDTGEAELNRLKRLHFSGRKSLWTLAREAVFKEESVMENTDAVNKAVDVDAAIQELAGDMMSGQLTII